MPYRIGFRGCQHLGYAARRTRINRRTGWNQRIVDGHIAHEHTMRAMLDADVDGIVDGGDLFHWSHPKPRDIAFAQRIDNQRLERGIWLLTNTGNHDASAGSDIAAVSTLHRPALKAHTVYPDHTRAATDGVGPHPGLYEIHQPDRPRPLYIHLVSHYGLDPQLTDIGITIDPQPIPDAVNILSTHGIFVADDRLFKAAERHGAERLIPRDWIDRGWHATILSDYHTLGPVPGFSGACHTGHVWYTGSALRRGFSDDPGPRGWILVELHDDDTIDITAQHIWQRPQLDFDPIDATGLTVDEINSIVTDRLTQQCWTDDESVELSGDGGWILRQRIQATTSAQRQGVTALHGQWARYANEALSWNVAFDIAPRGALTPTEHDRTLTTRVTDFSEELHRRASLGRVGDVTARLPTDLAARSLDRAIALLTGESPNQTPES